MRRFRTEDGYTFWEQPDGRLTSHPDPEQADMIFEDLDGLKRFVVVMEITDQENSCR